MKLLTLLMAFAVPSYAATTVTPGSWDLYRSSELLQSGLATQQACIDIAAALNVTQTYTCRTRTAVSVTAAVSPPPTCGAQPANQVRTATCLVGTSGSWVQTNTYVAAAYPTCWTASSWLPAAAPVGTCVPTTPPGAVNFTTSFNLTEFPISEGGAWTKANNAWLNVKTENGVAHAGGYNFNYDDSYAYLKQPFGPDQTVEAVLDVSAAAFDRNQTHEALLLVRMSDDSQNARGYECLFNYDGGFALMKWTGPPGGWQHISLTYSSYLGRDLVTGDVLKCSVIGSTITGYINNVMMIQAVDNTFASGQPGIGFFVRPGGDVRHLNFTSVTATSN
jgi:hypothetical protein